MEEKYSQRLTEALIAEALARYAVALDQAQFLGGFENLIYAFERGCQEQILRLAHSSRRSQNLIEAEVDWINYLASHEVPVAAALPSAVGQLVEAIDDGHDEFFLATAFEKAPGVTAREARPYGDEYFGRYGELLGRMHALTKDYQAPSPQVRRFDWDDPVMAWAHRALPATEPVAKGQYTELLGFLRRLPKGHENYGLVHYDAHGSNLMVAQDGKLTLIDFDDCAYGWFMQDLAIVLFYMVTVEEDREELAAAFLPPFLEGYAGHNRLDPDWMRLMPYFLKQREIELYAVIHRDMDVANLDNPRVVAFMESRKDRIEHGIPYLEMSFEPYAKYLSGSD